MTTAGISVRFVPAGLRRGPDGKWQLRGTVLLTPLTGDGAGACGQQVELDRWPAEIETLVRDGRIAVQISPVAPVAGTTLRPAPMLAPAKWLPAKGAGSRPIPADIEKLSARFQTLMVFDRHGFGPLVSALKQTAVGAAVSTIARPGTKNPDVVANGRGEMGLLLALERGSSVLTRLHKGYEGFRSGERLLTRAPGKQSGPRRETLPWLTPAKAPDLPATAGEADRWSASERARRSRQANTALVGARAEADGQATKRTAYKAATAATLEASLDDLAKARPSCQSPAACASVTGKPDTDALQQSLDKARLRHVASTQPTEQSSRPSAPTLDDPARSRFFALQSQPGLARLFGLAVDVTIDLDATLYATLLEAHAFPESLHGKSDDGKPSEAPRAAARFAFVTARIGSECGTRVIWTCAKLRIPAVLAKPDEDAHFWACTREEIDARALGWSQAKLLGSGLCSQIDGLLDLGADRTDGTGRNPRYDLATLDIPRVSESDVHVDAQATESPDAEQPTPVATIASGGLLLVDRWRQYQAVAQATDSLARAPASTAGTVIIDAEDLTTGLRLDVGLETKGGTRWRSLVERRITYTDPDDAELFARVMRRLMPDKAERLALDDALLTLPSRLRRNSSAEWDDANHPVATAFVEEIVAQWHGAPLGIDLHGSDRLPDAPLQTVADVHSALPVSLTYSLPDTGARPPRCCFGWSYRLGVRPVLAGGVVRTLADAARLYDDGVEGRLCLPSTARTARRVLRHERIEAPVVATPHAILLRKVRGAQATATELVVRSVHDNKGKVVPLGPTATHRVLVPAPTSLEFADRHDVFTDAMVEQHGAGADAVIRPRGGLRDVAFDQQAFGTFPVWSTQRSSEGEEYPDRADLPEPTGDAIFTPRPANVRPDLRKHPYYPDPAADFMVFRLMGEDGVPLPGSPLVVPTRRPGITFPDVTPIAIELIANPVRKSIPKQDRLVLAGPAVYLDAGEAIHLRPAPGRVAATRVTVTLEPGERFQLDAWCLPAWQGLADLFDLPESAILVAQAAKAQAGACLGGVAFVKNLAEILGIDESKIRAKLPPYPSTGTVPVGCGPGQLPLPGPAEIDCVARLIAEAAASFVIPELAARTTLWVTHAVDKPLVPPSFDTTQPLTLDRVADPAHGDTVQVNGAFRLDAASTRFVEVLGSGASLISGTFDNDSRGRSDTDRARGIWPGAGSDAGWRKPLLVFGFDVREDGTVDLPDEQARLLRAEISKPPTGTDPVASDIFTLNMPPLGSSISTLDKFSDSKARVVRLELLAGSRTAPFIRTAQGATLDTGDQTVRSLSKRTVLVPATKAPARVAPMTILPSFTTSHSTLNAVRITRLRIRARRPWFSSGPGERLGIVLWPPAMFDGAVAPSSGNDVLRDYDVSDGEPVTMDLRGYSDLDLGPGGAFVSRWGADPTRPGPRSTDWIIPPAAFLDVPGDAIGQDPEQGTRKPWHPDDKDADRQDVVYVPRVAMPLPAEPDGLAPSDKPPPVMMVSLLTYQPRFDVDTEHWYFDVAINPDAAVEPFIRLGLVRYQANAPRHLRVSEPVVEWAQLMPKRELTVTPSKPVVEGGKARYPLTATVSGPGQFGTPGNGVNDPQGSYMSFTLFRRASDGVEIEVNERYGGLRGSPANQSTGIGWLNPSKTWQTTFNLDEDPLAPAATGTYSVLAVERIAMGPSSYESEPYDPVQNASEDLAWSGPRFAARVIVNTGAMSNDEVKTLRILHVHND